MKRSIEKFIINDLKDKMVFLSGARQIGKTTLGMSIAKQYSTFEYLNWDNPEHKQKILRNEISGKNQLMFFDELHKYHDWKNYLKGLFDTHKNRFHILLTGSAQLKTYKKGGDSLMGRHFHYSLHPISFIELTQIKINLDEKHLLLAPHKRFSNTNNQESIENLLKFGGFPEPLIKGTEVFHRRWQLLKNDQVVKEDIRDLTRIQEISKLEQLVNILPKKVASIFSINNIRQDLQMSHITVDKWIQVLENFYYCYRIFPYQSTLIKSLKKESKLYLWDWSIITDVGSRFENFIGSHLIKYCSFLQDIFGIKAHLFYLRDKEQREVDFLITIDHKPIFAVEVKLKNTGIPKNLLYFKKKLAIPNVYQVVKEKDVHIIKDEIEIVSANIFLSSLV